MALAVGRAEANTGLGMVAGATPYNLGIFYFVTAVLIEGWALRRLGGLSWRAALVGSLGANALSSAIGVVCTIGAAVVVLASVLSLPLSLVGLGLSQPVGRFAAMMGAYGLISVAIEGTVYARLGGGVVQRPYRAAACGNALSHLVGLALLCASPVAFQLHTEVLWSTDGAFAAQAALEQYVQEHGAQPPADGAGTVNEALRPHLRRQGVRGGRFAYYDRWRWRGDYPELLLAVASDSAGGPVRVIAPQLDRLPRHSGDVFRPVLSPLRPK